MESVRLRERHEEGKGAPFRVALLGYGLAGSAFHAPFIHATPGLQLAVVVTGNPGRAAAAADRYPGVEVLPDADSVWDRSDGLDVAVLATPNRTHVPLGLAAVDAGLHVVVDKPLAASVADGRRLVEAAEQAGRILTVFQNRRWDDDFLTLRRLIDEGALGEVYRLESRFERWRPEPKAGWRQDPSPGEAGGLLFDLGGHLIDQALILFGPVTDIHAELDARRPGSRVDDDVFLALTHQGGVRSHLWMNAISARPAPRFRVLGSGGTWTKHGLDVQEEKLRAERDPGEPDFGLPPEDRWGEIHDGETARPTPPEPGDYGGFYRQLEAALRDGGVPPVDPRDAVAVLEIIEAARG